MSDAEQPTMMNCAMNFGAVVGLYYIGKFCLFPLSLHSTMAALLFLGLTLVVPVLVYWLVRRYRDQYSGGKISFSQAFIFAVFVMGFGALLAAVAHYIYFAYVDGGAMVGALVQSVETLQSVDLGELEGVDTDAIAQFNQYIGLMQQTMLQLQAMTPIDMTLGMLSNNLSWSIIVSLPIALLVKNWRFTI
jgi:hypothetical protein